MPHCPRSYIFMNDEFYVKVDDAEKGPYTFDQLTDGRLEPNDEVRTPFSDWQKASEMPDFLEYFKYEGYYFPTEETLAGFGIRLAAYVIDYVILVFLLVIGLAIYVRVAAPGANVNEFILKNEELIRTIVAPVSLIAYFVITAMLPISASIGQYACKLIIVNAEGEKIGPGQAFLRGVFKFLSGAFLGVGFLGVIFSKYKQGFHDVMSRTYVVRKDVY